MKISGNTLLKVGLAGTLVFGAGCNEGGESEPVVSQEEHVAEIHRLTAERDLAAAVLNAGQISYEAQVANLPDNCEKAVKIFIQPYGNLTYVSEEDASTAISVWCGPENLGAVKDFREKFGDLEANRSAYEVAELAIAQHLGELGVEPSPATTEG